MLVTLSWRQFENVGAIIGDFWNELILKIGHQNLKLVTNIFCLQH